MKSRSQDQSLSDSRELDRSYDPLTGRIIISCLLLKDYTVLFWLFIPDMALICCQCAHMKVC